MAGRRKTARGAPGREGGLSVWSVLPFLSGLSLGLLVALIVFLRYQVIEPGSEAAPDRPAEVTQAPAEPEKPDVKFTFYDTLRNKKVNISEWMAGEQPPRAEVEEEVATEGSTREHSESSAAEQGLYAALERDAQDDVTGYVLQAGSFKDFDSADGVKAQLAFLGIFADIQRVMLNEQDIRHRVRLGPYTSVDAMQDARRTLSDNGIEFIVIELR